MKTRKLLPFLMLGVALIFTMCKKDDTVNLNTYVGKWTTAEFDMGDKTAKMVFDFKETSFETEVFVIIDPVEASTLGVKGEVEPLADIENGLHITITDLGSPDGSGGFTWFNVIDDAQTFESMYSYYVEEFMPQEFDATYEIVGNAMDLIIPDADDTIELTRI
jgi:hypothetical protein